MLKVNKKLKHIVIVHYSKFVEETTDIGRYIHPRQLD